MSLIVIYVGCLFWDFLIMKFFKIFGKPFFYILHLSWWDCLIINWYTISPWSSPLFLTFIWRLVNSPKITSFHYHCHCPCVALINSSLVCSIFLFSFYPFKIIVQRGNYIIISLLCLLPHQHLQLLKYRVLCHK